MDTSFYHTLTGRHVYISTITKIFNNHIRETLKYTKHIITQESIGLDLSGMRIYTHTLHILLYTPYDRGRGQLFNHSKHTSGDNIQSK